jgi:hypothetical protein
MAASERMSAHTARSRGDWDQMKRGRFSLPSDDLSLAVEKSKRAEDC